MTPVGFITTISDLKKIIEDAEKLGLNDKTKIVFKDSANEEYYISSNILVGKEKKKNIYLEVTE